jgi:16S rRNA (guanine1207-N2)-methyltransferase
VIYGMFEDSFTHLEKGGTLLAVIRRKQGAESALKKMEEIFGNCETVSREKGYWVLKSTKLTD